MATRSENSRVTSSLCLALETLCEGCWSAIRVACVPNGLEYRFLVRIEAPWRPAVYGYLAKHAKIWIPPDGGPLNLSMEEALRIGQLVAQDSRLVAEDSREESTPTRPTHTRHREPRRMPKDLGGAALRDTFQP
jgi:hypothetical protein